VTQHAPQQRAPLWTRDFVILMVSTFSLFCSFYFFMPVLPLFVAERLGGDQSAIGLVTSLFTITAVTFRPVGGFLMDRFGRRGVHLLALSAFALVVAGYIVAGSLALLLVMRLLHGFPWGAANTAANTVASDLVPVERRGEGLGLFGMSQTLAMAVAPAAAIAITGEGRFTLLFASATVLAVLALGLALAVRHPQVADPAVRLRVASLLEGRVGWLSAALLFVTAGYGGITTFVVIYAKELGIANPGAFFTLLAVGLVAARLSAGRFFDRYGPGPVLGTGLALLATCYALLFVGRAGFYPAAVVLGMGFGTVVPSFQAMAPNMVPAARRGAAFATLLGAFDVGVGLGAYLLGHLARLLGYGPMYGIAGLLLLGPLLILYLRVVPDYATRVAEAAGG
jgi:MFS family permease